ncbi:MAG TPA: PAS domain S-box protein [Bacteroidetes bacterium]|nr:PAS domain S-box protein [Bacteroidota bacterium]
MTASPLLDAFRDSPAPLLVTGPDGRVLLESRGLREILGSANEPAGAIPDALARLAAGTGAPVQVQAASGAEYHATAHPLAGDQRLVTFEPVDARAPSPTGGPEAARASHDALAATSDAFFALDREWRFTYVNEQAAPLLDRVPAELIGTNVWEEFPEAVGSPFDHAYRRAIQTGEPAAFDAYYEPLGRHFDVQATPFDGGLAVRFHDVTDRVRTEEMLRERTDELERQTDVLEAGLRLSTTLAANLDPERLVQAVVDAGRELTGAAYAAFFYTPTGAPSPTEPPGDTPGLLYALSGASREDFADFPTLRLTPLFRPTFEGEGVIRSGDITADPRYGQQPPLHGMPPGHLPVRSYLAVPVHGASRERFEPDDSFQTDGVVGALLFGHPEPDTFDAAAERAARTLAGQASLALRNARLHRALAAELAERKRAETALRESEAQFREIAESLPQLVWTTTPEGYHDYFNERWYRYTGMPRPDEPGGEHETPQGFRWADYLHPDDIEVTSKRWSHCLATGEPYEVEYRFRRASDGEYRWFIGRAAPLLDAEGRIAKWFGTCTDIEDQKQAEAALRASEATLEAVLDALPVGVVVADARGRVVRDNAANRELWGVPPDTASWREYSEWEGYWPESGERIQAAEWAMARTLRTGEIVRNELCEIAPFGGGPHRFMLNNAAPVRDSDGRITAGVIAQVDVTERRMQEEALRQKNAEMERFAYTVSHDLKSPLVTVTGFLGLLKSHLAAGRTEKAVEAADRVLGAADRMGRLIEDLLDLSRAGHSLGDPEPVELGELAGRIAADLSVQARGAGGELSVAPSLGTVLADRTRLGEAIENLLSNAVRYGLGGGGTRIEVRSERARGGGLRLIVEDDGPGVPPPYRERVFGLFQRLSQKTEGTGVGLAVVARVMEVHGGTAHVESAGGPEGREGARFVLTFPREAVAASAQRRPPPSPPEDA